MRTAGLVRWLAVPAAVVVVSGAAACTTSNTPRSGVTAQELPGDVSGKFDVDEAGVGDQVSLRATVVDVLSPRAFTIGPKDTAGDALLVLTRGQVVQPGDVVQLAGTLRLFGDVDVVTEFGLTTGQAQQATDDFERVLVTTVVDEDLPEDGK